MPLLLESLDAVAVRLGRDLLFFEPSPMIAGDDEVSAGSTPNPRWR